ncbi:ornithine carbamoyltransferase [Candidatus Woesebacteria bacterium RIFCSPHIGHO2_01_FULL_39_32]|uniref:Ornithine carbamoyltransferase n=1 Tax=Candidatus Woesebacteria bacterium RIFCSPLOWO2_01_FULL_39_25 TaxID=1802521 RepID=A0A1F8BM35_9BACT|nr:MAG: ornithine carbamoyltransferase [Candidatus Woesebacteria bacterium GWB1_37_5]OGM25599.1 MAG: ornithine carbamoyltransferase [Candidatus Woesebacteria bacterium RIFCSPHIGHO2_01_FULL_39_32]OGM38582.1 MAG: ornithine carbamoyltransferase [Candidatus Woesebacteria bacterium RIFCSPHIGHO2_12_FULL_38_11]OGM65134.1 MAG: ornithine carbamoyltransferase [Candidatus Woesebacteria bacterium RIFCSPLOWO2_01_FULL_39_25]
MKHFVSITDLTKKEINLVLQISSSLKRQLKKKGSNKDYLKNKVLGMIFEKPSLRTRVSFEAGMTQMGGHAIYLAPGDIDLGKREPVKDVSQVLSRMVDIIMARTFLHTTIEELAKYSSVPVINALSEQEHPCQILADLLTIKEKKGKLKGIKLAFVGDGENNVTHSLALASAIFGMDFRVATPPGFEMQSIILEKAKAIASKSGGLIIETDKPEEAVKGVDIVYTDTWVSMGDESEKDKRIKAFKGYQVNTRLMNFAKKDAIFMHDMPAYRGYEVSEEVIEGKQSIIINQAENRLHVQKGLICFLLRTTINTS